VSASIFRLTLFGSLIAILISSTSGFSADRNSGGVTILSSKAEIQSGGCFSFEATVRMEAPPRQIYDALTYPENWHRSRRVIESPDHRSKTLEFDLVGSHMEPPGPRAIYRVQYRFDPEKRTVSGKMLDDKPLPWNEQFAVTSPGEKTETLVGYRSWECEPERPGHKPRTVESLTQDLNAGLQFRLDNIERGIRYAAAPPAPPEIRNGRPVYPTPVPTPDHR
jgi:hypothetical protein